MAGPLMIAAGVLGAVSAISGGNAADKAGQRNGALLDAQANETRRATVTRENLTRDRSARALSDQRAALLANGIDPTSGTALIGVTQSAQDAEMDALTLRYEGDMRARGMMAQAEGERYQARVANANAKSAKRAGYLNAAGSILGGVGDYMGYQDNRRYREETMRRTR